MASQTVYLTGKYKLEGGLENEDFRRFKQMLNFILSKEANLKAKSFRHFAYLNYRRLIDMGYEPAEVRGAVRYAFLLFSSFRHLSNRKKKFPCQKQDVYFLLPGDVNFQEKDKTLTIRHLNKSIKFHTSKYHKKFKSWTPVQYRIIREGNTQYLLILFKKKRRINKYKDVMGIDVNEGNITIATPTSIHVFAIPERQIRKSYNKKFRSIQAKIKSNSKRECLLNKYRKRVRNRMRDRYFKIANEIVKIAKEQKLAIALEDLQGLRKTIVKHSRKSPNLLRWGFAQIQSIIESKAKEHGIKIIYINPKGTSTYCPVCGSKLHLKKDRKLACNCGLIADRDLIGAWNIRLRALQELEDVGCSRSARMPAYEEYVEAGSQHWQAEECVENFYLNLFNEMKKEYKKTVRTANKKRCGHLGA